MSGFLQLLQTLRTNPLNYFHVPFILDHMRSVGITELNNVLMFPVLCGEEKTDPYVKNVSFLIFRLAWNFHQKKPEVIKQLRVKSLIRKFSFV